MATSQHEVGCMVDGHHWGPCLDEEGKPCEPTPGRRTVREGPRIETTRMQVDIPAGPQPITGGPLHAVVRGPGGLDITLSGGGSTFGRMLTAIGDTLSAFADEL